MMAEDSADSSQPMTLDALVAEILALRVQEQELAAQLAEIGAQRGPLEAQLVALLREQLGPDLAAQVGAALLPPISPASGGLRTAD